MRISLTILLLTCITFSLIAQEVLVQPWCATQCNSAGDEKEHTISLYEKKRSKSTMSSLDFDRTANFTFDKNAAIDTRAKNLFPLRIVLVNCEKDKSRQLSSKAKEAINKLNNSYQGSLLEFEIDTILVMESDLHIEDLYAEQFKAYNEFSQENDLDSTLSVFIFEHKKEFCEINEHSIRCGKIGGFSYILSSLTNNLVLSAFDLDDEKVVAHEFGHFFGLYHPFEEAQFGKDNFDKDQCEELGDRICDTPPDPGSVYEVYVNYSNCNMMDLHDKQGNHYAPLINNIMSYYKPCYLKEYKFTAGQVEILNLAAESPMRKKFVATKPESVEQEVEQEISTKRKRKCWLFKNRKD